MFHVLQFPFYLSVFLLKKYENTKVTITKRIPFNLNCNSKVTEKIVFLFVEKKSLGLAFPGNQTLPWDSLIKLPQNKNKMTTKRKDDQKLIKLKFRDKETRIVRTFKKNWETYNHSFCFKCFSHSLKKIKKKKCWDNLAIENSTNSAKAFKLWGFEVGKEKDETWKSQWPKNCNIRKKERKRKGTEEFDAFL